jgi:ribonucleoside-diphosphate reductase alpha chain
VEQDQEWTLLCPSEFRYLPDLYGEEFDAAYEHAERTAERKKVIRARALWTEILKSQAEVWMPYMLFKDACNAKSNQKNIGTIRSSNLCTEVVQFSGNNPSTGQKEIAVCNLASISLPHFVIGGQVDHERLAHVASVLTRNIDNTIDTNWYPVDAARESNMRHRPIGIGVQGLANALFKLRLPFESEDAQRVNREIFETIYFGALRESCRLARERGPYSSFEGSPASQGILQFDMWDAAVLSGRWDWNALKGDIAEHGLRNSLLTAPMPTATTAQILNNYEAFEPIHSNMYTRRVLSGEFACVNEHLIRDLQAMGLWGPDMKDRIIAAEGSIQGFADIPADIRALYKTAYEIDPKVILNMAAERGCFVDQSQSLNAFFPSINTKKLSALHFYAWKKGLKTGMYYLRSRPAASAQKVSLAVAHCESCSA